MDICDPRIDPRLVPDGSKAVVIAEHPASSRRCDEAPHQAEYRDLPSVRTPSGYVITRWTLTEAERMAIARGEDVFVTLVSHGPIKPFFVTVGPVDWNT